MEIATRIRAGIFDFDGVLIPSPLHTIIRIRRAAKMAGVFVPAIKIIRECWDQVLEEIFTNFVRVGIWSMIDYQKFIINFNTIHREPFPMVAGVMETLKRLKEAGIELTIVSSRSGNGSFDMAFPTLRSVAQQSQIDLEIFGHIQTAEDHKFMKPDSRVFEPTLLYLDKLGIKLEEILVIGDTTDYDFAAANNHRPPLQFVAVNSMISLPSDFVIAGLPRNLIIERITDLPKVLQFFP